MKEQLVSGIELLAFSIDVAAAVVIGLAVASALLRSLFLYVRQFLRDTASIPKEEIRLRLGQSLVLALELLLAADILRTAMAPTWDELGRLSVIILMRTVLNLALHYEFERLESRKSSD